MSAMTRIYSQTELQPFACEPAHEVRIVPAYRILDGRNAWHSTWVDRYYPGMFSLSLNTAKWRVECNRTQGSKWTIQMLPSCLVLGEKTAALLIDANVTAPFRSCSYNAGHEKRLNVVVSRTISWESHQYVFVMSTEKTPDEMDKGYLEFTSSPGGKGWPLYWSSHPVRYTLDRMKLLKELLLQV
jgi:hypothetical protein